LAHGTGGIDRPPPKIGEHNAEILGEAGYTTTEITAFAEEGVV
jgi:crotonobetainyl-CoA:carnitine CoA-transferase CaiB-like acyl-CoA transferase